MNKYVKSLGLISLFLTVSACRMGDSNESRGGIEFENRMKMSKAYLDLENLKNGLENDKKKLGEISIRLALMEPVLFKEIFSLYDGKNILNSVDFEKNAQCELSFIGANKLKLNTSLKYNDFDIENTDVVEINESAVKNVEAFVALGGKLTGFDKDKMKFTWNVDTKKLQEALSKNLKNSASLFFNKVEVNSDDFLKICRILKCFNLKDEKFGFEECLKDNKFFGLDVSGVNALIQNSQEFQDVVRFLADCLRFLDDSCVKIESDNSLWFWKNKGLGNDENVVIDLSPEKHFRS